MIWVLLAATGAGAEPLAQADVVWAQRPTGEQLGGLYPLNALKLDADGRAVVTVTFDEAGATTDCTVKDEELGFLGFGAATCAAAKLYRAEPTTRSGLSVAGRTTDIALNWRLPPPEDGSPRRPPFVATVEFLRRPNGRDLSLYFPDAAMRDGVQGGAAVVLEFEKAGGAPLKCDIFQEKPADYAFGWATCRAASDLRAPPRADVGERYRYMMTMYWKLPGD